MPAPDLIYKVVTSGLYGGNREAGRFVPMPVDDRDGYIHFSTAAQLPETLARHFAGQADLILLAVRTAALGPALRWEISRGGDRFPHLYGQLPLTAIVHEAPLAVSREGEAALPDWVA